MVINIKKYYFINLITFTLPIMIGSLIGSNFNISISDLILPICMLLISREVKIKKYMKNREMYKISTLYILLIIIMLLVNIYKINLLYTVSDVKRAIVYFMKIVINIFYFIIFYFMFKNYNKKFEFEFLKWWNRSAIFVSIMAIIGVVLYSLGINTFLSSSFRATSTFNDPNLLGSYMVLSISISSIYNYYTKNNILGANILLEIVTILLTASRGVLISCLVAISIILFIKFIKIDIKGILKFFYKSIVITTFFLIIIYAIKNITGVDIFEQSLGRINNISENLYSDSRFSKWKNAILIWYNEPILGAGLGMFRRKSIMMGIATGNVLAHNTYLNFISELGIIGFIIMLWLPIQSSTKLLISMYSKKNIQDEYILFSMIGISICAFSLNMENFRCIWIFFAYVLYYIFKKNSDDKELD